MFHACVQRFDGMDEKILGGELNRALERKFLGSTTIALSFVFGNYCPTIDYLGSKNYLVIYRQTV